MLTIDHNNYIVGRASLNLRLPVPFLLLSIFLLIMIATAITNHIDPVTPYVTPTRITTLPDDSTLTTHDRIVLPASTSHVMATMQVSTNITTVPVGFQGLPDSSGIYRVMYYLSRVPSTSPSNPQGDKDFTLEAMVFRTADFRNGVPSIQQRVPIQKLSVQIRYNRLISPQTTVLTHQLLDLAGLSKLYTVDEVTVDKKPILVGDQVQTNHVMKPISDYLFVLPSFPVPSGINEIYVIFTAMIVPTSADITAYRQAISRGAVPASENPFFSASIRITTTDPPTTRTVTTILLRTSQWTPIELSTAQSVQAYSMIDFSTFDFNSPQVSSVWSILRNQTTTLSIYQQLIQKIPDLGNNPTNPNFLQLRTAGRNHYLVYSFSTDKENPIPSYYAPQQLLPLQDFNSDSTASFTNLFTSANARDRNVIQSRLLSTTSTLIAVAPPSNLVVPNTTSRNNNVTIPAYPVQLRLLPFTSLSSQFILPQYSIAYWPQAGDELDWVDVQLQLQLVKLTPDPEKVNVTAPASVATNSNMLDMSNITHSMGILFENEKKQHKMHILQNTNTPSNGLNSLVITPSTTPDLISTDMARADLSNLLNRFTTSVTYDPLASSTIRYNMDLIRNDKGSLWSNTQARVLYHFDFNLYALRSNATKHDNNQEYAVILFYQFITSRSIPREVSFSDWAPFVTRLPTIAETLPSSSFPFDTVLPNMNSIEFSTNLPSPPGTTPPPATSTIIPVIPNNQPRRTSIQPIRVNEKVDLETTENLIGDPTLSQPPIRDGTSVASSTVASPADSEGVNEVPSGSFNSTLSPGAPITSNPNLPPTNSTNPGNSTTTTPPPTTNGNIPRPRPPTGPIETPVARSTYPVSPLYPTIGYNTTWFLARHNPSSPYLFRHDVIPASLRATELAGSTLIDSINNPQSSDYANSLFVVDAIPSLAVRFIAEVLDMKINIHINDHYQGTYNMKQFPGETINFSSGVYNDVDGDGIRDSPALHNTDPQAYIRPFNGERWMSPVIQLHPDDLLGYSFTYQLRPFAKFIPEWADPRDEAYQTQVSTTTVFPYPGARSFVHAILPIESASPDPAELITAPIFKYSVKVRPQIPASRIALSFTIGRISSHDGGLLGLPPLDPGVCYSTSQQLPLRGRHNVWMRMEFMPVSVLPLSPAAALRDSEGTLQSGFAATLPEGLKSKASAADFSSSTTSMSAVINYVLSTLPPLLEEWWYFDGLKETTSSLLVSNDFHATFSSAIDDIAPFPDPDPGLRLKATPSEELMLYAFTIWPQHNENDLSTSSSLIYSPDTFTQTGRAIGFSQCYSLFSVCF